MSYPGYVQTTACPKWEKADCDAITDHVLAGVTTDGYLAYPYSYIIRKIGGVYDAINSVGTRVYGGATDEGSVDGDDAAAVIQAAIDALTTGGKIFFQNGVYTCTSHLTGGDNVVLVGETRGSFDDLTEGVVLHYTGADAGVFLDFQDCRYMGMENMKLYNTGNATVGLRVGGAGNDADRTKAITLRDVVIDGFATGILGSTYGPDDCSFYDVFVGNSSTCGIDNMSSQVRMFGGSIYGTTGIGVRHTRLDAGGHPDCSLQFFGTIWSGPAICIDLVAGAAGNLRTLEFYGCWFESVATGILNTQNTAAGLYVADVLFSNCKGYTDAGASYIFDLRNRGINVRWEGGELYPADNPTPILTDGLSGARQRVRISYWIQGIERISFTDTNTGLRGFERFYLPIMDSDPATGVSPSIAGDVWTVVWNNTDAPWAQYQVIKAYVNFKWDPNSTSGGIRLAYPAGTALTGSARDPGSDTGVETYTGDISAFARASIGWEGEIALEMHHDGAAADPTVYKVWITYEY